MSHKLYPFVTGQKFDVCIFEVVDTIDVIYSSELLFSISRQLTSIRSARSIVLIFNILIGIKVLEKKNF